MIFMPGWGQGCEKRIFYGFSQVFRGIAEKICILRQIDEV
jgi:hypothetical protein